MKTKTKRTDRSTTRKGSSTGRTSGRGVNTDEQNRITNARKDEDEVENSSDASTTNVEEEEDREKRRKIEDEQGE